MRFPTVRMRKKGPVRVPTELRFHLPTMFDCTATHTEMSCVLPTPHLLIPEPSTACHVPSHVKMTVLFCNASVPLPCILSLWVGLFPLGAIGYGSSWLEYSNNILTFAKVASPEWSDSRGAVWCSGHRSSLTPTTFPWLPHGGVLRRSTSGSTETILMTCGDLYSLWTNLLHVRWCRLE